MAGYQSVISNDTLTHKALSGSPETLCGKLVVDHVPPFEGPSDTPNAPANLAGELPCDICETLSGGGSFIKENIAKITEAGRACSHCKDGFDQSGNMCLECGGTGWLSEGDNFEDYYSDLTGIDTDDLRGTKVAAEDKCENGCGRSIAGTSVQVGNENWCLNCASTPAPEQSDELKAAGDYSEEQKVAWKSIEKEATNWTRDGAPIEDGFTVTIDKELAARTPFLDYTRVAVSEKRECPDCHTQQWVSKIAGCDACGGLKCNSCMESIGMDTFFGMCKLCASSDSDLAYETEYEDPYQGGSLYLNYLMSEDEGETDPLFLPNDYE